jgi:hypothetical protein
MRTCLLEQLLQWMARFVLVTCLAAVAVAQTPEARIGIAMARAQEAGIPISLLESKRAEGNAKGIPIERIATAVETRLQHLERARVAMSRGVTDLDAALLSVGADAIATGVSESVLTEIASAAGKDRRAVAVAALTYLVSREGLASNVALTQVKAALKKGPDGLTDLMSGPGVAAGKAKSNPPGNARGKNNEAGPPAAISAPGQGKPPKSPKKPDARGGQP